MFKFARIYIGMVCNLLQFIRASREGIWLLHLASLEKLCTYFFSQNRLKYAQNVPEYIARMYELKTTDPEIWEELNNGNFCVKKSTTAFCSIGVDHALEQENRKMKVLGGLTGITRQPATLARFFLVAPELARLSSEVESSCGVKETTRSRHHQLDPAVRKRHEDRINSLRPVIEENNPFDFEGTELLNMVTKSVMPTEVTQDILAQDNVGEKAYVDFVSERLTGDKNMWDKMTKVKLKTWNSPAKVVQTKIADKVVELKENRSLFARMVIAARARPEIELQEAISKFEFSSVSRALFATDGSLLPCQNKSKLMNILEKLPESDASELPSDDESNPKAVVIDGMAVLHETPFQHGPNRTCKDLANQFIKAIQSKTHQYDIVHIIFDHYNQKVTLKRQTQTRRSRGKQADQRSYICTDSTPIRLSLDRFLCNNQTKHSLTIYLASQIMEHVRDWQKEVVVSTQQGAVSNHANVDHLTTTQDEADTIIFLHALDIARSEATVHILSPDTDVFVLALRYLPTLGESTCIIRGVGDNRHKVALSPIYNALGPELVAALPGFHSFTGCDTTGQFCGKGKLSCWKVLLQSSTATIQAFIALGKTGILAPQTINGLEEFVCHLYSPGTKCKQVGELRWKIFKRNQAEAERLPPTSAALYQHILRAHYQAMIWFLATDAQPRLPPATDYGWNKIHDTYVPIVTALNPAPDAVIELVRCGCKKSLCTTNRCSCKKANLMCTEMCSCESADEECLNSGPTIHADVSSDEDSQED